MLAALAGEGSTLLHHLQTLRRDFRMNTLSDLLAIRPHTAIQRSSGPSVARLPRPRPSSVAPDPATGDVNVRISDRARELHPGRGPSTKDSGPIAQILEKGLLSYIEERRMERLREELLRKLGLTEEELGEMDPEERAEVEKFIEAMIHARLHGQIDSFDELDPGRALREIIARAKRDSDPAPRTAPG